VIHFFDTSVLVAAFQEGHAQHPESHRTLVGVDGKEAACSAHSLAEFYAVTTRFPSPERLTADQAQLFVDQIVDRLHIVSLNANEYLETIRNLSSRALSGGKTYDALLLACARKAKADRIYTLNLRHFRALAPDLADRIVTP
jgi:predicted nucleic acid-binding protein